MAKVTAGSIITEVGDALNDPSHVRWVVATLYRYIFAGEKKMSGDHPEVQYDTKVENPAPTLLTGLTDSTTISDGYASALVHYVAWRCFNEDSDDAGNQRLAAIHFQAYKDIMGDK